MERTDGKERIIDLMLLLLLEFELSSTVYLIVSSKDNHEKVFWVLGCSHAKARRWRDQMLGTSFPGVYLSIPTYDTFESIGQSKHDVARRNHMSGMHWSCDAAR